MKRAMALLAAIPVAALAQGAATRIRGGGGSASADGSAWSATANIDPAPAALPPAITGAPYSGDEVRESVRVLTDGSRMTAKTVGQRVYRDSQGRTRVERPIMAARAGKAGILPIIEITDPIAGRICDLDVQNHVAHCSQFQPPPPRRAAPARTSAFGLVPQAAVTEPQKETIDGIETVVTKSTRLVAGRSQGYDRDVFGVIERWYSPELGIVMMEKNSDPVAGENTYRIENFSRVEPSFELFQVPADYLIKMETAPFTISYSRP